MNQGKTTIGIGGHKRARLNQGIMGGTQDKILDSMSRSRHFVVMRCVLVFAHKLNAPKKNQHTVSMFDETLAAPSLTTPPQPREPTPQEIIQEESKALLLQRYGSGPHLVEF